MRVTFLAHDGFLIELDSVCLLFSSATATPTIFNRKSFVWRIKNPTFNFCWGAICA